MKFHSEFGTLGVEFAFGGGKTNGGKDVAVAVEEEVVAKGVDRGGGVDASVG